MTEKSSHICTECFYTGAPSLSIGRLFIEFIANLLVDGGGLPLFQKVRHCPECGSHSMVTLESEAGLIALATKNEKHEAQSSQSERIQLHAPPKSDEEYTRIRLQR